MILNFLFSQMVISCIVKCKSVSHFLSKNLFVQINGRSSWIQVGKSMLRSHLHHSPIRWTEKKLNVIHTKSTTSESLKRLFSLIGPERYKMAAAVGLLVISSSVTMAIPFAMGKVIDIIYSMDQLKLENKLDKTSVENENITWSDSQRQLIMKNLEKVCGALIGVFIIGGMANFGRVYLMRMISQRVAARIRSSVYSSIGTYKNYVIIYEYFQNRFNYL